MAGAILKIFLTSKKCNKLKCLPFVTYLMKGYIEIARNSFKLKEKKAQANKQNPC